MSMRVCVYGAGAVGGHMASRLAAGGAEVALIARGAHLAGLRANGLTLQAADGSRTDRLPATDDPAELGPQDVVLVSAKATGFDAVAAGIGPLLGPETAVVFAVNGIPWWYLEEVDPTAPRSAMSRAVDRARVVGCVVSSANAVVAPGLIRNYSSASRFLLGELDGSISPRCSALAAALTNASSAGAVVPDIRRQVWQKLISNTMFWPVACLTGCDNRQIVSDPELRDICLALGEETVAVAAAHGVRVSLKSDRLVPALYTDHKSSVLQDLEAGRRIEIDHVPGTTQRLARLGRVPTPVLDMTLALARRRAATLGLYP
jgi:2-dehydropantoate 2-reductase